jgi:hypothetical protein
MWFSGSVIYANKLEVQTANVLITIPYRTIPPFFSFSTKCKTRNIYEIEVGLEAGDVILIVWMWIYFDVIAFVYLFTLFRTASSAAVYVGGSSDPGLFRC